VSRTDRQLLLDALDHLEILRRHQVRADLADETVADAVSLRLAAAIEAVAGIDRERREQAFGDDWALIWATRNRIAHGYAVVDRAMIKATVDNDLPVFEATVRHLLEGPI
jgi:uncharacterized protein with HEPN domain